MEEFIAPDLWIIILLALREFIIALNNPWIFALFALWIIFWKGVALWRAAQRREMKWFIAMLLLNTLAILEIVYIFVFSKRKDNNK